MAALYAVIYNYNTTPGKGLFFNNQIGINEISMWLNVIYMVTAFLTVIASPRTLNQHGITFPEFYPLMLFAVSGMFFMTSGTDLIVIFVGLELLSISLYVLIGMAHNEMGSLEATLKYFLLGAFTSGFMLMGIAFYLEEVDLLNWALHLDLSHRAARFQCILRLDLDYFL